MRYCAWFGLCCGILFSYAPPTNAAPACPTYATGVRVGQFANTKVDESSGVAASRRHPGVWWTHNDSGGKARIFAFDETGKDLGYFDVKGAASVDWEDIAAAPCPDGTPCLYIADVGDNSEVRTEIQIYRIPEPTVDSNNPTNGETATAEVFRLKYPDRAHNCETLLVHPKTRDIILVTKETNLTGVVFRLPGTTAPGEATLEKVTTLTLKGGTLTGGDISPEGDQIVLRTYGAGILYAPGADGIPRDENKLSDLTLPFTLQGEAIAYSTDGQSLLLTSEQSPAPIYKLSCTTAPPEPKPEPTPEPTPPDPEPKEPVVEQPDSTQHEPTLPPDASSQDASPADRAQTDDSPTPTDQVSPPEQESPKGCACSTQAPWDGALLLCLALLWVGWRGRGKSRWPSKSEVL